MTTIAIKNIQTKHVIIQNLSDRGARTRLLNKYFAIIFSDEVLIDEIKPILALEGIDKITIMLPKLGSWTETDFDYIAYDELLDIDNIYKVLDAYLDPELGMLTLTNNKRHQQVLLSYYAQNYKKALANIEHAALHNLVIQEIYLRYLQQKNYAINDVEGVKIDKRQLPTKTFRQAWRLSVNNGVPEVTVDMVEARNIHMDRLKTMRDKKLSELNDEYAEALDENDNVRMQQIVQQRRQLRKMTTDYDLEQFANPKDLEQAIPDYLRN